MLILSIETSCDDTSAAILNAEGSIKKPHFEIVASAVSSQNEIHSPFGGIVPNLACRAHEENLAPVIYSTLNKAQKKLNLEAKNLIKKINFIAVTNGPGLAPSLLMGVQAAKTLAFLWNKKIVPVNHLIAHIYANFLDNFKINLHTFSRYTQSHKKNNAALTPQQNNKTYKKDAGIKFPALALLVSGGHTQIILMKKYSDFKTLGRTRDDAAGETFDKAARILEIGYPGGPEVSKRAKLGNSRMFALPRPMLNTKNYDFSFSGLKTAILYLVRSLGVLSEIQKNDLCASIQEAIVDVLVSKTTRAAKDYKVKTILLGGGVSANAKLVSEMKKMAKKIKVGVYSPPKSLCTDNAQMIAIASYFLKNKKTSWRNIRINANLKI